MIETKQNIHAPTISRWVTVKNIPRFVKNPITILQQYVEEYGDIFCVHRYDRGKTVVSVNPELNQYVLQKNHRNYKKSKIQTEILAEYVGKGLLTSEGPYWLQQRRLIQPGFHRKKLAGLVGIMNGVIDSYFEEHFDRIAEQGMEVDIYEKMMEIAFWVVARAQFSSGITEKELHYLAEIITETQEFFVKQVRMPFLEPWYRLTGQIKKNVDRVEESNHILLRIIRERKQSGERKDDLLDMLLATRYEDTGEGMTEQQLLEETIILFVAGHETSANALAWAVYLMTQYPETANQIRAEMEEIVGNKAIGFEDLPKLHLLRQTVQETMRIYPPAWITDRIAVEDDNFHGLDIPKGTFVVPYIYGTHHSKQFWENPERFNPRRFSKEAQKARPNFAYMPFGGGPRLCIGNNFAMMEMQLVIGEFLRRYDVELVDNQEIIAFPLITLRPKHGIKVRLKKR